MSSSARRNVRALMAAAVLVLLATGVSAASQVRGRVTGSDGLPLPGATVLLNAATTQVSSTLTDEDGNYVLTAPDGHYRVVASLSGFKSVEREAVITAGAAAVLDITLPLAAFAQEVTVTAAAPLPLLGEPQPDLPSTVTREVIDSAMLPNSQYDDVLALMPNVVRGPDGQISVAGARATQGALLINGVN